MRSMRIAPHLPPDAELKTGGRAGRQGATADADMIASVAAGRRARRHLPGRMAAPRITRNDPSGRPSRGAYRPGALRTIRNSEAASAVPQRTSP